MHEIELAEDSGLKHKASFDLMSMHTNLGYTHLDAKNYLQEHRQRNMVYGKS